MPVLDSVCGRGHAWNAFRREVDDFRITMLNVLQTDSDRNEWQRRSPCAASHWRLCRNENQVVRMAEEVQALNRSAFIRQQKAITRRVQVSLSGASGKCLGWRWRRALASVSWQRPMRAG